MSGTQYCNQRIGRHIRHIAVNSLQYAEQQKSEPRRGFNQKICDGLEITVREFFDSDLFDSREQEIE